MPEIAVAPFTMKDSTFNIAADDFAAALSSVSIVPSSSTVSFQGLKPAATYTDVTPETWLCNINFAQDWDTTGALSRYLHENTGAAVEATFEPKSGGASITATIIIVAGAFGGDGGSVATASAALPVRGRPVLSPLVI